MYCNGCGAKNPDNASFCSLCGAKLVHEDCKVERLVGDDKLQIKGNTNDNSTFEKEAPKLKFYQKPFFSWIMLLLCWPVGLYLIYSSKTINKRTKQIVFGIFVLLVIFGLTLDKKSPEKTNTKASTKQEVAVVSNMTDAQYNEMGEAYNAMLSNKYPGLYKACNFTKDGQKLLIEVSSMWFNLHEEDKKAFIKQTGTLYSGMLGARSIKHNVDNFEILIRHNGSGTTLATWDSVFGPKIKK